MLSADTSLGDGSAGAGVGGFGPGRVGAAGQALTQITEQPVVRTSLLASSLLALSSANEKMGKALAVRRIRLPEACCASFDSGHGRMLYFHSE
ncbi:MAG: hypothetical protein ACK2U2_08805 [Anaerolineae bacterium]|jgi:hypothetical protein